MALSLDQAMLLQRILSTRALRPPPLIFPLPSSHPHTPKSHHLRRLACSGSPISTIEEEAEPTAGSSRDQPIAIPAFDHDTGKTPATQQHVLHDLQGLGGRALHCAEPGAEEESSSTTEATPAPLPPKREFHVDRKYLACCEPGKQLRVGVLLSGGVDSSVALRLLVAAGHSCTAFYLKIWFQEDFENFWASCPWDNDLKYAQAVCDEVGIELHVVQLTEDYWKNVVSYMIAEYKSGRTPNPDVLCNSRIKFGVFLDYVKALGFDRVASGHYARLDHNEDGSAVLLLSQDEVKDQTYFLSNLTQSQLSQLIFPLGCIPKGEVRQLAELMGLPNKQRKDSQGICFLGKVKFSDFICRHLGEKEGRILEAETGNYLGNHKGYWFHTIGQRQGLRLSQGPWYVVDKDLENNVVFVSKDYFSVDKKRRIFEVESLNWFSGHPPKDTSALRCKVRHGPRFYNCSIDFDTSGSEAAVVRLSEDDQGLAAGQYAAFYEGDVCIGSGVIAEYKAEHASAVSPQAREAAKLKDFPVPAKKSKSKSKKTDKQHVHPPPPQEPEEKHGWFSALKRWVKNYLSWFQSR